MAHKGWKILQVLLIALMMFNQAGPVSAQTKPSTRAAAAPGVPETPPPTASPTPLPTETPTAETAQKPQIGLTLSAASPYLFQGETVQINWQVNGYEFTRQALTLQFDFPAGVAPALPAAGSFDPATGVFMLAVTQPGGSFEIAAAKTGKLPALRASLLAGKTLLAKAGLELDARERFALDQSGGEISARQGRIRLSIPPELFSGETRIEIGAPLGSDAPPHSLSGNPFELKAYTQKDSDSLHKFNDLIEIEVPYDELNLREGQDVNLRIFWYNHQSGGWEALPSALDREAKVVRGFTDHFSVFDLGLNNWQAGQLPNIDSFQVSQFSGAGTFSFPFEIPSGPAGLKPELSLSYNSQVVDQTTAVIQPSWVGMGWSLEPGSVVRNTMGTDDWIEDDTFSLNIAGVSSRIIQDASGNYFLSDENFWRVEYDSVNQIWSIRDKQGSLYTFEQAVFLPYKDPEHCGLKKLYHTWYLTSQTNIYGQKIVYGYSQQTKPVSLLIAWSHDKNKCVPADTSAATATYLATISYELTGSAVSHYRARLARVARSDYNSAWDTDSDYHTYQKERLKYIFVEQDAAGDGTFETVVRAYELTYHAAQQSIFPGFVFSAGSTASTLGSIRQYGRGSSGVDDAATIAGLQSNSFSAYTFTYEDGLHLTQAKNRYGGKVVYTYDPVPWYSTTGQWNYTDKDDFGRSTNPCQYGSGTSSAPWAAFDANSSVDCTSDLLVHGIAQNPDFGGIGKFDKGLIRPGGMYKMTITADPDPSRYTLDVGLNDGSTNSQFQAAVSATAYYFQLPANADDAIPLIRVNPTTGGYISAEIKTFEIQLLPSFYRVTSKRYSADGSQGDPQVYNYSYSGAQVNDHTLSPDSTCPTIMPNSPQDCWETSPQYSEFRGHQFVTEVGPDGRTTTTEFYQDDKLRGRQKSAVVTDQQAAQTFSYTATDYTSQDLPIAVYRPDHVHVYLGLAHTWVYPQTETSRVYAEDGTFKTKTVDYSYEATYGNLLTRQESADGLPYRSLHFDYYPTNTAAAYLVGLPARQWVTDKNGVVLSKSLSLFDGAATHTTPPTTGELTATRTWVGAQGYSQVSYEHDSWGNQTAQTGYSGYATSSSTPTSGAQQTSTAFDPVYHTYPITVTNSLGWITQISYDTTLGLPIQESGQNVGETTSAEYDAFGRMTKLIRPEDSSLLPTLQAIYHDEATSFWYELRQRVDAAHESSLRTTYDGLGRQTRTESGEVVDNVYTLISAADTVYVDAVTTHQYLPGNVYFTTTSFDFASQTSTVTAPDGSQTSVKQDGLKSRVEDARESVTITETDIWGRTISVTPPSGPGVTYTYDTLDRLISATRAGNTTKMKYDNAGRKTNMDDPDMGAKGTLTDDLWGWSYGYDALGNLKSQTDARGCTLDLDYDLLNRLYHKDSSGAGCGVQIDTTYWYDEDANSKGRRTRMEDASGSTSWSYDARGRMTGEDKTIDGQTFSTGWTYNSADLPLTMTYPGGEQVTYTYNGRMLLNSVTGTDAYVTGTTYDSAGRITNRSLGSGLTQGWSYYTWNQQGGRLQTLSAGSLQALTYTYDSVGNIQTIIDAANSYQKQCFTYDSLDRLKNAATYNDSTNGCDSQVGVGNYSEGYAYYAATGNLRLKMGVSYTYDSIHPHAVASLSNGNAYTYDANGSMITRHIVSGVDMGDYTLAYDAENRLVSVQKNGTAIAAFAYDGDGRQVKSTLNGETTLYAGAHYEVKGSQVTQYYFAGASRIAMRKYTIPQNATLNYLLGDHLGSTNLVTDASGALVTKTLYKAWGEVRYTTPNITRLTDFTFTDQRSLMDDPNTSATEGFGLMFYNARWYDPYLKQFTSPDSLIPDPYNSLDYNRYAYARYNPLKYTDSTGHWVETALDIAFIGYDLYDISQNGWNWENGLSLAADVAGAALPLVTGGGVAVRAIMHADDVVDAAKVVNAVDDVVDVANAGDNLVDAVKTLDDIPCSFTAGTQVSTPSGSENISAIKFGDYVLAWDEADGTLGYYPVTAVLTHEDQALTEVIIDGEWLETTPEHPFYTEESGWLPAGELGTGMHVRQADGTTGLVWLKWTVYRQQEMYNLTVATAHTFFVGDGQWLVHNTCDPWLNLPERSSPHDPTTGILLADGQEVTFTSGKFGPALQAPGGPGSGFDAYTRTHVEGHVSAWMQQNGVSSATLYINNPPCPNCSRNLPRMLPSNSTLDIFGPNGYFGRFNSVPR